MEIIYSIKQLYPEYIKNILNSIVKPTIQLEMSTRFKQFTKENI